jgi:hypothetical protein
MVAQSGARAGKGFKQESSGEECGERNSGCVYPSFSMFAFASRAHILDFEGAKVQIGERIRDQFNAICLAMICRRAWLCIAVAAMPAISVKRCKGWVVGDRDHKIRDRGAWWLARLLRRTSAS